MASYMHTGKAYLPQLLLSGTDLAGSSQAPLTFHETPADYNRSLLHGHANETSCKYPAQKPFVTL
mgnify:CR=1 FL=1